VPPHNVAALVHLVGFLTGAALYGLLFALVLRRPGGDDRLPLVTAILGLIWNVSGLAAFGVRDFAGGDPPLFLIGHRIQRSRLPACGRRPLSPAFAGGGAP
jgi:hypothetical protein